MVNILPLFSTPICITNVQEQIVADANAYAHQLEYDRFNSNSGWVSKNKYVLNDVRLSTVKTAIEEQLQKYVYNELMVNPEIKFYITNSWVVKYDKGDWGRSHIHTNSLLSGVVYLQVDENSSHIWFERENNQQPLFPSAVNVEFTQWNIFNSKSWKIQPQKAQLLFFPSNVMHGVATNNSEESRYALAFNIFARGKFGSDEYALELL